MLVSMAVGGTEAPLGRVKSPSEIANCWTWRMRSVATSRELSWEREAHGAAVIRYHQRRWMLMRA